MCLARAPHRHIAELVYTLSTTTLLPWKRPPAPPPPPTHPQLTGYSGQVAVPANPSGDSTGISCLHRKRDTSIMIKHVQPQHAAAPKNLLCT